MNIQQNTTSHLDMPALIVAIPQGDIIARFDAYDRWSARLEAETESGACSDADWQPWDAVGAELYGAAEALPDTVENAPVKARALVSLYHGEGGDIDGLFDEITPAARLALGILKAMVPPAA